MFKFILHYTSCKKKINEMITVIASVGSSHIWQQLFGLELLKILNKTYESKNMHLNLQFPVFDCLKTCFAYNIIPA